MWNYTRLESHLLEIGKIKDKKWVDTYLRIQMMKAMIHLNRAAQYAFVKRSSMMELFGVDFMLDDDLNLWFLECNSSPVLKGTSEEKEKFLNKMLSDMMEIIIGYLRSRSKRMIQYINDLSESLDGDYGLAVQNIPNLEAKRKRFKEVTMNYFEPEFDISKENGFYKIIDENLEGVERYAGLVDKSCL
jgi:hypothetical protein